MSTIDYSAFYNTGLKYVNIPQNVTSIMRSAFSSCYDLDSIASFITSPFAIDRSVFNFGYRNKTLYVPTGTVELYKATEGWNVINNIVEMPNSTDIASIDKTGVKIWPYVTSSTIHIDLNDLIAENINIINMDGITMYSAANVKGQITIDLSSYMDGMYIVNVKCKDGRIVRKIVKVGK